MTRTSGRLRSLNRLRGTKSGSGGFVAKLRLGDSSGESSALGGGYAQASLTKVSHDKLERV